MDTPRKNSAEEQKANNNYQETSESDSEVYNFLDNYLEKENTDSFSLGFSKNIIREIEAKQQCRFNIKIYGLIFMLSLISIPLFISFISNELISMILTVFLQYKFIFAFFICGVILIQFSERLIYINRDKK